MLKYLTQPSDKFQLQKALLYVCKKDSLSGHDEPQIDFLSLERQVQQLRELQQKTCENIVEFVDQHR